MFGKLTFLVENGAVVGLTAGAVFCGIIALVSIFSAKKETKAMDFILESLDDEHKDMIKNQKFEQTKKKSLFSTDAYIGTLKEKGNKFIANLLFYNDVHDQYYVFEAKIPKKVAASKDIKEGSTIPVLMTYDNIMKMYNYKKIMK